MENLKVDDIVSPATDYDALSIGQGWVRSTTTATRFKVAVVVKKAITYRGPKRPDSGVIVLRANAKTTSGWEFGYPYIWSANRFIKTA